VVGAKWRVVAMKLEINRNSRTPIYMQIINQLTRQIISGNLEEGYVLPSERKLSEELEINRSTVNKAYNDLKADGLIVSKMGKGTVVQGQMSKGTTDFNKYIPKIQWNQMINKNMRGDSTKIIKQVIGVINQEDVISFAGGFVGSKYLPVNEIRKISDQCYEKYGSKMLLPTSVYGCYELRNALQERMKSKGINCSLNQIMVLTGSQQGLDYFARCFIQPGDMVFVEEPSYLGAIEVFKSYRAQVVGIPIDENGMRVDILENYLLKYRPKFIYTLPTFQNPSGHNMSLERRKKLLELAYTYQIPILEDDPYSDLRFEGESLPSLKALDKHGYVTYLSTFSKSLFMGYRIGWVIAEDPLIEEFGTLKQMTDLHSNTASQYILTEVIQSGFLDRHIRSMIAIYKTKKELMVNEIRKYEIEGLEINDSAGGFYIWCKMPENLRPVELMDHCERFKVAIMPGEPSFPNGTIGETYVRLNYTFPSESEIVEGVRRFAQAVRSSLSEKLVSISDIHGGTPVV